MAWTDNLRAARFRNARFHVLRHDTEVPARRVQLHEYPGREEAYAEDLGRGTGQPRFSAYVIGADYMAARDALIAACGKPGVGTLVHPYLGEMQVLCTACRLVEETTAGRMATFSLEFVDAGTNRYPVDGAAVDLALAVAPAVVEVPAAVRAELEALAAPAALLAGPPSELARTVAGALGGLPLVSPADRLWQSAAVAVAELGVGLALETAADWPSPGTPATPARARMASNQAALARLLRTASAVAAGRAAGLAAFQTADDALDLRRRLGDALDLAREEAAEAGQRDLFDRLGALRTAVVRAIDAQVVQLPRVVALPLAATQPALVAAYRAFGDTDQVESIVWRNRARHPGFMPAGEIEVLSRALRAGGGRRG